MQQSDILPINSRALFPCPPAVVATLFAAWMTSAQAQPPKAADGDSAMVTIRFLRHDGGATIEPVRLIQSSCPTCHQSNDTRFARENIRETIVAIAVPRNRSLELEFDARESVFDRATLQNSDLPLVREGSTLRVDLPPIGEDTVEAGEFSTHVIGRGYVLRFEHADPERRFGAYATTFPTEQRQAANVLEFAMREVVIELGLGESAIQEQAGIIEIMGFDTNDPHGHLDAPPHVHMHLRWPYNSGTQIGHFYLAPDGRIKRIKVGASGLGFPSHVYQRQQTFNTISPQREVFFSQTITADGALIVAVPDGRNCRVGDTQDDFRREIHVSCTGHVPVGIQVADDLVHGVLTVRTGDLREVFRYDPRTGLLLSPDRPPANEASDAVPTFQLQQPEFIP